MKLSLHRYVCRKVPYCRLPGGIHALVKAEHPRPEGCQRTDERLAQLPRGAGHHNHLIPHVKQRFQ
jgi:hypothetical protein